METAAPELRVGYWVNRASRALLRDADERLRPLGFSMGQLPVLRALMVERALSQKELARLARVEQPTMAEMLARMERDGVVKREPNPEDRRGVLISLTPRSRSRIARGKAALDDAERAALAGLSAAEQKKLQELLQRVAANLEVESAA